MKTCVTLFGTPENINSGDLNFICFGSPRCGTSMVAGAMIGLGINMGDNLPVNVEDPVFNPDGKREKFPEFIETMKLGIYERQARGIVWGWKYPQAVEYLPSIQEDLKNPRLVIVYRDPVPATIRAAHGKAGDPNFDDICYREMDKCIRLYRKNIELAREWQCPTLLVSYERASQMPEDFLQELAAFCRMEMPQDTSAIIDFMRPGEYKDPNILRR